MVYRTLQIEILDSTLLGIRLELTRILESLSVVIARRMNAQLFELQCIFYKLFPTFDWRKMRNKPMLRLMIN